VKELTNLKGIKHIGILTFDYQYKRHFFINLRILFIQIK